jgi:aspartate oxidase
MKRIKKGDLVRMHTHDTGLVGIVVDRHPKAISTTPAQVGIIWTGGSGKMDWEPEGWLEVVSESR